MSHIITSRVRCDPAINALTDEDIDDLVERLTPAEIQKLLEECEPDDPAIPASLRTHYHCDKMPTGPLDRKKLLKFINEQAMKDPDKPELVPYVPGVVRGKRWVPPPMPEAQNADMEVEIDIDLDEECESALASATAAEIIDLAGILGFHSMMNQDQYHAAQSDKWADRADPELGWDGITKATPLKMYPPEEPNRTDPVDVICKLQANDQSTKKVNLNNVHISEDQFLEIFDSLRHNDTLTELSMSNTTLSDFAAANLACSLESNKCLEKLNIETNNVSPQTLVLIFEAANIQQVLTEIKASNQKNQLLGNKVEMAITQAIEKNKTILKVGLNFEFGGCRNRVNVQLQKNLDRIRLKRLAVRLISSSRTGGFLGGLPGQLGPASKWLRNEPEEEEESEYEYYYEEDEEVSGSR